MDCLNHPGTPATAYCQNCGKPLCTDCIVAGAMRTVSGGQILCDTCLTAWQNLHAPFAAPPISTGPSPAAAAVLGFIPGVGAMYNAQYAKAFIHVCIFVFIIYATDHFGLFGLFIPAWVLYQVFEAYHTAKARRDGTPLPDPLGLNDLKFGLHVRTQAPPVYPATGAEATAGQEGQAQGAGYAPYAGQATNADPYAPVPPTPWRRPEPIGAIILIALGVLFLLGQFDFFSMWIGRLIWPVLLIALGVYLLVRKILSDKGANL